MILNNENRNEILEKFQATIRKGEITLSLKNGATLRLEPVIDGEGIVDYKAEYLTGKDNKEIRKLKSKIAELNEKIEGIKQSGEDADEDVILEGEEEEFEGDDILL